MEYEWDDAKATANRIRHGVPFEAVFGFDWESALIIEDLRGLSGDERHRAIGLIGMRVFVLVFAFRRDKIRVISLRRATASERSTYDRRIGY